MLKVESGVGYDACDLRLMVHDRGIHGQCMSDAVIALHAILSRACSEAGLGSELLLSTHHLLHCAQLCKHLLDLGVTMETALTDAAHDVYVRSVHDRMVANVRTNLFWLNCLCVNHLLINVMFRC